MPELPEVETILCGLKPHFEGATIQDVVVRFPTLRWPIPATLKNDLVFQHIESLQRRGKYLLMRVNSGTLIIHLGMSGSLCIVQRTTPIKAHDHVDIIFSDEKILRYNDPRRFGAILWTKEDPLEHSLLKSLGVEPLQFDFTAQYLKKKATGRRMPIKSFIMDSHVVVGIGNIYAAESLFLANIHPAMPSGQLTITDCERLVESIQQILQSAINQGGTTLKDYVNSDGKPGYFKQQLNVYGRAGLPCPRCQKSLQRLTLGQRNTVFCGDCQPEY